VRERYSEYFAMSGYRLCSSASTVSASRSFATAFASSFFQREYEFPILPSDAATWKR
jgi:hypothetical protein